MMGKATRDAYGEALKELGAVNPDIVVLDADLSASTKTQVFAKAYPDRFFDTGIAEGSCCGWQDPIRFDICCFRCGQSV